MRPVALLLAFVTPLLLSAQRAATAPAATFKVETGEINGSHFRIDMPMRYNGTLVMYCHGYGGAMRFDAAKPLARPLAALVEAGYAVAQAGYASAGWAVKEGIEDTEALRRYFVRKYGRPKRSYVTGHSMGGTITLATIERYPDAYDGALPLCGPLSNILEMFQKRMFDALVVFDYYFADAIGSPALPNTPDAASLQRIVDAAPQKRAAMARWLGLAGEPELIPLITFYTSIVRELSSRAGGNPFDNRNTIYWGGDDDAAMNRAVKRFSAVPQAVEYLRHYYSPTGRLTRPVLSIHTTYDPIVPVWAANPYSELTRFVGTDSLHVQRWVGRSGHCGFTPTEIFNAFHDLKAWAEMGKRPEPGEQK